MNKKEKGKKRKKKRKETNLKNTSRGHNGVHNIGMLTTRELIPSRSPQPQTSEQSTVLVVGGEVVSKGKRKTKEKRKTSIK